MNKKNKIRICVDARPLIHQGGITRYTTEMIRALSSLSTCEIVLIAQKPFSNPGLKNIEIFIDKSFSFLPGTLWFLIRAPKLARKYRCDFLWGIQHILPKKDKNLFYIVTWHDVVWKKAPSSMKIINRFLNILLSPFSIKNADKIICVSKTTEKDLLYFYPNAKGKTAVVYEGKSLPDSTSSICPNKIPFLFTVGSLEPRKNIVSLLHVFKEFINIKEFETYHLIIAGPKGWKNHSLFHYLKKLSIQDKVIFTGYLSDDELVAYFKACNLFVFPSIYEGFGLPLLEAEGKCPVVANDIPVFRELEHFFENLRFCNFSEKPEKVASYLGAIICENRGPLLFKKGCELTWQKAAERFLSLIKEDL